MPLVVVVVVLEGVVYTGGGGVWEPWDGGGAAQAHVMQPQFCMFCTESG